MLDMQGVVQRPPFLGNQMVVFSTVGTTLWQVPLGVYRLFVTTRGASGGSGGGGSGSSGLFSGYSLYGAAGTAGTAGGVTTFGASHTANGGGGGSPGRAGHTKDFDIFDVPDGKIGADGTAVGGQLNLSGQGVRGPVGGAAGSGGGPGSDGGPGGQGGFVEGYLDVVPGMLIPVTIGAGGVAGTGGASTGGASVAGSVGTVGYSGVITVRY